MIVRHSPGINEGPWGIARFETGVGDWGELGRCASGWSCGADWGRRAHGRGLGSREPSCGCGSAANLARSVDEAALNDLVFLAITTASPSARLSTWSGIDGNSI